MELKAESVLKVLGLPVLEDKKWSRSRCVGPSQLSPVFTALVSDFDE